MAIDTAIAGSGLYNLPLEVLQEIAGYLADSYRPSLTAFSLINKVCYNASTLFILRQIYIKVHTREKLQHDIDRLIKTISHADSTYHIYSLTLEGFLDLKKPRNEKGWLGDVDPLNWWNNRRIDDILPDEEPIHSGEYIVYDGSVIKQSSEEDIAWAPVVSLIKILPSLQKLVYNCPNQFPPSLLDTLNKTHCKLYHFTFRLRTLLWGAPYSYEMALATSPCLYSIKAICSYRDSDDDDDFNQEAVMELVSGLAPSLKEVTIINIFPGRGMRSSRNRARWQGLPGFISGSIGSLTSLSLVGSESFFWWPSYIQTWAKFTDFSALRYLTLGEPKGTGINKDIMEHITQNYSFPQLISLHIHLERLERGDANHERLDYSDNTIVFLTAFKPLEELSIVGPLEPDILEAITYRHGQKLKKLALRPLENPSPYSRNRQEIPMIFAKEHILQIQTQCPALEELSIPVKRMQSNGVEVEIYRSFAKFQQLKSLFLILDCSDWRVKRNNAYNPPFSFDKEDLEDAGYSVLKGHLRETLMNCAVDETLARSIWDTIRGEGKRLESLKLWTTGAGQFGHGQCNIAEDFFINLSRSWLIERVPRDDQEIISVKELGRSKIEAYNQRKKDFWGPSESEKEVFRRIWPSKEGSKSWNDDWSSLPLQV